MKERLRAVRKKFNLTQEEFADRLGIKRGAISNYEIGRNVPIDAVLSLICREFGVNPEWLKMGTGEMMKAAPTDELDALAKKYHLRHKDYVLIEKIAGLSPQERDGIFQFMADVISASTENGINPDQVIFPDKIPDSESLYEKSFGFVPNAESTATEGTGSTA